MQNWKIVVIGFGVLITVLSAIGIISEVTRLSLLEVSNITAAFGSILLSSILAFLYLKMYSTQEKRTDIHENQEEILEKQVEIDEKQQEILETEKESLLDIALCDPDGDECRLFLSNHGGGVIKQVLLRTQLAVRENEGEWSSTALRKEIDDMPRGGQAIGPREKNITMTCTPDFQIEFSDTRVKGSFSEVTRSLSADGIASVKLSVAFYAVDEHGNVSEGHLFNGDSDIYGGMELEDVSGWEND